MIDLPATRRADTEGEGNVSPAMGKEPWKDTRREMRKEQFSQ